MKIIVVGCGKVGYRIADTLSSENYDITVIDTVPGKVNTLSNRLDAVAIKGNGASYSVLKEAGVEKCDVLIAVTNQDEVNILCCLIARKAANCKTIARVRDPNYYSEIGFIKEELGLSMAINPELSAASACYHLVRSPFAMELDRFASGKAEMITFNLPDNSDWIGKKMFELNRSNASFLVAIIQRRHTAIIPNGSTVFEKGDRISIMVESRALNKVINEIGIEYKPVKNVMIAAGGNVGYYLAKYLCEDHIKVTIIDSNYVRCEELCELLPKATIINGDPCEEKLLVEEGVDKVDAFCSLTANDSENIMMSFFVGQISQAKRITRINKSSMSGAIEDMSLGSIVSPKELTAESILRYIRALDNADRSSSVEAVYKLAGDQVEALAFNVKEASGVTNKNLMNMNLKSDILVCAIVRNNEVIIPSGQDSIQLKDQVIIATTRHDIRDLTDILNK